MKDVTKAITTENNKIIGENEGVFNPYYFLIVIPKNLDQGYLILEQKRGLGIKSIFKNVFLDSLTKYTEYSNYKIELSRVFPEELKKNFYEKGKIESIKLIKKEIPEDEFEDLNSSIQTVETIIKLDDKKTTPENYLKNNEENLLSFKGLEYDIIKVKSIYKNKPKTFTLTDPTTIIPYLDITEEIDKWDKGNPNLESIHKIALNHLKKK